MQSEDCASAVGQSHHQSRQGDVLLVQVKVLRPGRATRIAPIKSCTRIKEDLEDLIRTCEADNAVDEIILAETRGSW